MALYLGLGLVASALLAFGLLLMKSRGPALPEARARTLLRALISWLRDPIWLGGLGLETAGYAFYIVALAGAPVSLLAVMMQGGIALFVLFAALILGERASKSEWLGIAGVIAAMLMLGLSLGEGQQRGGLDPAALTVLSVLAVALAAVPAAMNHLVAGGIGAAIASGIAFGLGSLYTKALTEHFIAEGQGAILMRVAANPYVYLAIAANLAGLVLLQNAFHRARGLITMPLSSALSNVVPILGGMVAFGETLPPEPLAAGLRLGAFALTIVAGAFLSGGREQVAWQGVEKR